MKHAVSPENFDAVISLMYRMTERNKEACRAVVVDGRAQIDVAREYGMSKQQLNAVVARFNSKLQDTPPEGWQRVDMYLPPEYVAKVRELEARARRELNESLQE